MVTPVWEDAGGGNVSTLVDVVWGSGGSATAAGDYALLEWTYLAGNPRADPTGFTLISEQANGNDRCTVWERTCTGSESGAIGGWNNTGVNATNRQSATLKVFRDTAGRDGAIAFLTATSAGTTRSNPSVTPSVANCGIVVGYAERATTGTTGITAPTTPNAFTNFANSAALASGNGGSFSAMAGDLASSYPAGVAVSAGDWTAAASLTTAFVSWALALRPIASDGPHYQTTQYGGFF